MAGDKFENTFLPCDPSPELERIDTTLYLGEGKLTVSPSYNGRLCPISLDQDVELQWTSQYERSVSLARSE